MSEYVESPATGATEHISSRADTAIGSDIAGVFMLELLLYYYHYCFGLGRYVPKDCVGKVPKQRPKE